MTRVKRVRLPEHGAVMVEAAIAMSLVLLLIFSVIWGAFVFRAYLTVEHAASQGARAGTVAGNSASADFSILDVIRPATAALGETSLQRVVVYEAGSFDDGPSEACRSATTSTTGCNVYVRSDIDREKDQFGPSGWPNDDGFPAWNRNISRANATYLGVYIEANPKAGGLGLPAPESVSAWKVLRVEARTF